MKEKKNELCFSIKVVRFLQAEAGKIPSIYETSSQFMKHVSYHVQYNSENNQVVLIEKNFT